MALDESAGRRPWRRFHRFGNHGRPRAIVYHLAAAAAMMGAFLDALGIAARRRRHPERTTSNPIRINAVS
jgi:hypothetical protein